MPRSTGLLLIAAGVVLVLGGLAVLTGALGWFGRLPGDIRIEGEHSTVLIPLTSMILVSLLLTLVLNLLRRLL